MVRLAFVVAFLAIGGLAAAANPLQPAPGDSPQWWRKFAHQRDILSSGKKIDILFVGDSLIEFWPVTGEGSWQLDFQGLETANLGMAADRVEQVAYRIAKLPLAKHSHLSARGYDLLGRRVRRDLSKLRKLPGSPDSGE